MSERAPGLQGRLPKFLVPILAAGTLIFSACGGETSASPASTIDTVTSITPHLDTSVPDDLETETNLNWKHDQIPPTLYVPPTLTEAESTAIAELTDGYTINYNIPYAVPTVDGNVRLKDTAELWPLLQDGKTLSLTVGEDGDSEEENAAIMAGWQAALNNPQQFAESVTTAADALNASTLDLNFRPAPEQRTALVGLIRAIRDRRPNRPISLDVPMYESAKVLAASGYAMGPGELPDLVHQFNVLTSVQISTESKATKPNVDSNTALEGVEYWIKAIGDESRVAPEFDISQSADMMHQTNDALRARHPQLGRAFLTTAEQATLEQLMAIGISK